MDERDRAKRALVQRLVMYLCLPLAGAVLLGLIGGGVWALVGFLVGVLVVVALMLARRGRY